MTIPKEGLQFKRLSSVEGSTFFFLSESKGNTNFVNTINVIHIYSDIKGVKFAQKKRKIKYCHVEPAVQPPWQGRQGPQRRIGDILVIADLVC
jgi:hypothetical protein